MVLSILSSFFQFDLAKQFLDPYDNENYGKGEDPLVVDTLIAETNAGSVRWLNGLNLMPVSAHKFQNADLSDVLLPVRGYSVDELKEMEKEKRKLKLKREQEDLERQRQEAYEEIVNNAAQAMIPALFEFDTNSSACAVQSAASSVKISDDKCEKIDLPGDVVAASLRTVDYVALVLPYCQNVNSTSLQQELIPVGTAPASAFIEKYILSVEPDKVEEDLVKEKEMPNRTMFGALDNDADSNAFNEVEVRDAETDYVHRFDAFDPSLDFPSYDDVGPDGQEKRLSQLLADEVGEEQIEYSRSIGDARSLSALHERVTALEDARAKELLETEQILSASPDSRLRSDRLDGADSGAPPTHYDQTKLAGKTNHASALVSFSSLLTHTRLRNDTGISSDLGMAPGELSEILGYDESTTVDGTSSFDGVAEPWGEKLEGEAEDLLSNSASRRVRVVDEDGFRREESRLSEILTDEVYDAEKSLADYPITLEDYERQAQEILKAERAELLETQAIMNAPPGAEDIVLPQKDDGSENDVTLEAERTELLETQAIIDAPPTAEDVEFPPNDDGCGKDVIIEADQAELLETQAIINAPPGAEDIALPPREDDRGNDGNVFDELAILEMDEDSEQGNATDSNKTGGSADDNDDTEGALPAPAEILSIKDLSDDRTWVDEPNGWGEHGIDSKNHEN